MQFLPNTFTAALGGKVAGRGQKAAQAAALTAGKAAAAKAGFAGKGAGTAKAAHEVFGAMLGEARRVQADGASAVAAATQQSAQARTAVLPQMKQAAKSIEAAVAGKAMPQTAKTIGTAVAEKALPQVAKNIEAAVAEKVMPRTSQTVQNSRVAKAVRSIQSEQPVQAAAASVIAAVAQQFAQTAPATTTPAAPQTQIQPVQKRGVSDMLAQAVNIAPVEMPVIREAAPKAATKVATNTRAAENLVERVAGKNNTPVATADASAQNIQNVQEAMLEAQGEHEAPRVKVANPYTRHTTDGVTYTLQEVSFTRQDLQELRETLVKEGVAPAKIADIDALIEMPDGATLGQVMLKLQGERAPVELEDSEMDAIDAQLSSVDPSGVLSTTVMQAVAANNPQGALNQLSAALEEMDADETVEVTKSGMLALGKALGMDEKGLQEMAATFGDVENATVTVAQFGALLAPAAEKIVADKASQEKLDAALSKTLKPIIAKARQRMEKENQAHSLQDRKVAQSKAQIERSVQEKSRDIIDATLDATGEEQQTENVQRQSAVFAQSETVVRKPGQHRAEKVQDQREQQQAAPRSHEATAVARPAESAQPQQVEAQQQAPVAGNNANSRNAGQDMDRDARQDFGRNMQQDAHQNAGQEAEQSTNQPSSWQELLGKVDVQPAFTMAQPMQTLNAQFADNLDVTRNAAQPEPLAQHLVNQVENGVLRTLRNGATSLELQLHPQELGTLNIVLTSYNGEVSARIITDKSETAEMLNHQLDTIRASLEEQGVKVEKVEVTLRQSDQENSDQPSWQDTDSHNSWAEQDARRQTLARMRNLANVRNNTKNSETETLERSVHIMGHKAENAATALDLVA